MEIGHIEFISFEEYKNKALGGSTGSTKNHKQISNKEIEEEMMKVVKFYENNQKAGGKINGNI